MAFISSMDQYSHEFIAEWIPRRWGLFGRLNQSTGVPVKDLSSCWTLSILKCAAFFCHVLWPWCFRLVTCLKSMDSCDHGLRLLNYESKQLVPPLNHFKVVLTQKVQYFITVWYECGKISTVFLYHLWNDRSQHWFIFDALIVLVWENLQKCLWSLSSGYILSTAFWG